MVPTRVVRFKFNEGEKVLCYEPDPKKAKVLYDSKVLGVAVNKDNRGRKNTEYLVHFNGWNSSWDRYVDEGLIVKDNEKNRTLQKRLAEEAAIHLRGGKKRRRIAEILKGGGRCKRKWSDSDTNNNSLGISDISDSSNTSKSSSDESQLDNEKGRESMSNTEDESKPIEIHIPEKLRKKLEEDYILINKSKKLLNLPCNPNVVMILEGFVQSFVGSQVCCVLEKTKSDVNYSRAATNINLCKEVVDGLRIYFDFTLPILLIYNAERLQYETFLKNYKPRVIKTQIANNSNHLQSLVSDPVATTPEKPCETVNSDRSNCTASLPTSNETLTPENVKRNSKSIKKGNTAELTICNSAHLVTETPRRILRSNAVRSEAKARRKSSGSCESPIDPPASATKPKERHVKITRSCQKPLRQNSPTVDKPHHQLNDAPLTPSKQPSPVPTCNAPQSTQTLLSTANVSNCVPGININSSGSKCGQVPPSDCSSLLNDILSWKLLPCASYEKTPAAPSVVYGAQHLLRLLVKLPDLLKRSNMPEKKTDALLQHLQSFLEYLTIRDEQLFSSSAYIEAHTTVSAENSKPMPN